MFNIEGFIYGYFLAHFMPGMLFLVAVFAVLKQAGIIERISVGSGFLFIILSILFGAIIDGIRHNSEGYDRSRYKIIRYLQYPFLAPCEDCNKEWCAEKISLLYEERYKQPWYYSSILGFDILNSLINRFYYFYEFFINTTLSLLISIEMIVLSVWRLKIPFYDTVLLLSLCVIAVLFGWLLVLLGIRMRCNYNRMVVNAVLGKVEKGVKNG